MSNTTDMAMSSMQGKSLSRARREAMSFGGKAGLATAASRPVANARPAASVRPVASAASSARKPQETISMPPVKTALPEVAEAVNAKTGTLGRSALKLAMRIYGGRKSYPH